jgi:mannosyl-oligosaccharide alpha-1,2-mannosidase
MRVAEDSALNQLRPEAVESLWHLWRLTGHAQYREWGWAVFQAFQRHSKGEVGYHSIKVRSSTA